MNTTKSPVILSAASNLAGLSFIILTFLKSLSTSQINFSDEVTAVSVVTFLISCIVSFISIRSSNKQNAEKFEIVAEYIFLVGLILLLISCLMVMLKL